MHFVPYKDLAQQALNIHSEASALLAAKKGGWEKYMNEARRRYIDLLNRMPDDSQIMFMLGTSFLQTGESCMGWMILKHVAALKPDFMDVWNNLGACFRQEHHNDDAKVCYLKALEVAPDEPDVLANLCALQVNEGEPDSGIEFGEACLAAKPDHPQGVWNLGLLYLEAERYEEGFKLYNRGFETGDRITRNYTDSRGLDVPFWEGEGSGRIVLWGEQGQGDEILFSQFIPEAVKHFDHVIIDCHPKLYGVMSRSFPDCTVYPTRKTDPTWSTTEAIDYKQSIASLARWFHGERKENVGWMKPDRKKVEAVKEMILEGQRIKGEKGRSVVGIGWLGGKHKTRVDLRSVFLDDWGPILDLPITIVSHQYTDNAPSEVAPYANRILHWQGIVGEKNGDFDWNAAVAAACDLTITVNTSVVHACGAMNIPCWTMTPYGRAWRYGRNTAEKTVNPFYKSVIQYNQQKDEPWSAVVERVAADLKVWLEDRK